MIVQQFDGGISALLAPHLIGASQGAVYTNINSSDGLLQPSNKHSPIGITVGKNDIYFPKEDEWIAREFKTSYVIFQNSVYMSDGINEPSIYRRGEEFSMNLPVPTADYRAIEGAEYEEGDSTGTYQYVCTYYDPATGRESSSSSPSDEFVVKLAEEETKSRAVEIKLAATREYSVRIYRVGGMLTRFTLVKEVSPTDSNIFVDKVRDSATLGVLLHTISLVKAPIGLTNLVTAYGMLFGSVENKLRFTPIGQPGTWPEEYEIVIEGDITGLAPVATGVLVFTASKTFILLGTGPSQFTQQLLAGDTGCISHDTIQAIASGAVIWQGDDGLYISSGAESTNVSYSLLGLITSEPINAVVHKRAVYLLGKDGTIICWDYKQAPKISLFTTEFHRLLIYKNKLCGQINGEIFELFASEELDTFYYTSPVYTEGSYSTLKNYKKVYIYSERDIIIKLKINGDVVNTFELDSTGLTQLQVPVNKQRGHGIQFEISGKGKVYELRVDPERGHNG